MREPHQRVVAHAAREDLTIAGPVPHVMWNRGTEAAVAQRAYPPRSAHLTRGKVWAGPVPAANCSFSSAAKSTQACAHSGPVVLGTVEARGAEPVLQGQLLAIPDAEPALFGAVDEEQSPNDQEGLPTLRSRSPVHDEHAVPTLDQFTCATRPARFRLNHDDIGVCHETQD